MTRCAVLQHVSGFFYESTSDARFGYYACTASISCTVQVSEINMSIYIYNVYTYVYVCVVCLFELHLLVYLLTAFGLTTGGSSTVHIYAKTAHRTTQWNKNTQNGTYVTIRIH